MPGELPMRAIRVPLPELGPAFLKPAPSLKLDSRSNWRGQAPGAKITVTGAPVGHMDAKMSVRLRLLIAVISTLLLVCLAIRIMNYETRLDEELFVPPTRLLDDHRLYLD